MLVIIADQAGTGDVVICEKYEIIDSIDGWYNDGPEWAEVHQVVAVPQDKTLGGEPIEGEEAVLGIRVALSAVSE